MTLLTLIGLCVAPLLAGMAITLITAARNAACDAVVDLVDIGSGSNGKLRIRDGSNVTLCDINLSEPAFGSASTGVATAAGLPLSGTASATGTAANYQVLDENGAAVWSGTAGTSGTDMILDNTSIASGQTITVSSWTHTQPA